MNVTSTKIPDVLRIDPEVFTDARGFFIETWHRRRFAEHGIDCDFVQDNYSRSFRGTLRGLHYQLRRPQGKLVYVTAGEIFDVAVDLRRSSPSFGKWVGEYLSAENRRMLWIPPGFAHGFYVVSDVAECQYKCSSYYAPEDECCIRWNDPDLAIQWPLSGPPLLSDKDLRAPPLARAACFDGGA
jgi:dTDP-4-dehydrorhamnose 3,5-epimerase